jgi:hypothetical protein
MRVGFEGYLVGGGQGQLSGGEVGLLKNLDTKRWGVFATNPASSSVSPCRANLYSSILPVAIHEL